MSLVPTYRASYLLRSGRFKKSLLRGHQEDPDPDSDSSPKPDLDSGFESLKKRIFDKLNKDISQTIRVDIAE